MGLGGEAVESVVALRSRVKGQEADKGGGERKGFRAGDITGLMKPRTHFGWMGGRRALTPMNDHWAWNKRCCYEMIINNPNNRSVGVEIGQLAGKIGKGVQWQVIKLMLSP